MRFKGKKPIASYRDTWDAYTSLRPVIAEWLRKFLEVRNNPKHSDKFGVPVIAEVANLGPSESDEEYWSSALEKMYFAFSSEEPSILKYNFKIEFVPKEEDGLVGSMLVVKGSEDEYRRYQQDVAIYHERQQEGYELFGKHFRNLWW